MTTRDEWLRVAWPIALLGLFCAAFTRQPSRPVESGSVAECGTSRDATLDVLERCYAIDSDDIELILDLGQRYESAGRWEDAERVYRRAAAADPSDGDVRGRLAYVLLQRGDTERSRRESEAALGIQPGRPVAPQLVERSGSGNIAKP